MSEHDAAVAVAPGDEDQDKVEGEAKVIAQESIRRAAEGAYGVEVDPGLAHVANLPAKPVYAIVLGVESNRMYFGRMAAGAEFFFGSMKLHEAQRISENGISLGEPVPSIWFTERTVTVVVSDEDVATINDDGELPESRMIDYGIGDF